MLYLNQSGDLLDYNSYNYHIDKNGNCTLNDNLMIGHMDI